VAVIKTGPASVTSGANAAYTISLTNAGPSDAANVALTDAVPAQTTFASFTQTSGPPFVCVAPAIGATGAITCNAATLPASSTATFQLVVHAAGNATGTIMNTVDVTSTTDSTPTNNTSTTAAPVVAGPADVSISKTANASNFAFGSTITYTIVATNAGAVDAANTVVTDVLPAGTTFTSASSTQGSCAGTTTVTCTIGTLAGGTSATITLVLAAPGTVGPVTNTATVSIANTDPNPANNASSATVLVGATIPALSPFALMLFAMALAAVAMRLSRTI
jgi:uncharacterized repeat protein (TIGR01451 family)